MDIIILSLCHIVPLSLLSLPFSTRCPQVFLPDPVTWLTSSRSLLPCSNPFPLPDLLHPLLTCFHHHPQPPEPVPACKPTYVHWTLPVCLGSFPAASPVWHVTFKLHLNLCCLISFHHFIQTSTSICTWNFQLYPDLRFHHLTVKPVCRCDCHLSQCELCSNRPTAVGYVTPSTPPQFKLSQRFSILKNVLHWLTTALASTDGLQRSAGFGCRLVSSIKKTLLMESWKEKKAQLNLGREEEEYKRQMERNNNQYDQYQVRKVESEAEGNNERKIIPR